MKWLIVKNRILILIPSIMLLEAGKITIDEDLVGAGAFRDGIDAEFVTTLFAQMGDHGIDEFIFSTGAGTGLWHVAEGASLTGDIVLPDDFDLVPLEGFGGEFVVFEAEGEGVATARSHEEG